MSTNWIQDIENMHAKFGVNEWVNEKLENGENKLLKSYLSFRLMMMHEELGETMHAAHVDADATEVVDGIIDLCVFAIGTLNAFGVDTERAWDEVLDANMIKTPGVKPERANQWGLPDLIKQADWKAPSHRNNVGNLKHIMK
jgi:predicted HAD superfamily Cof-like phosphohydrolase